MLGIFLSILYVVLRGLFLCADQETGIDGTFCAGGMELAGSDDEEEGNKGYSGFLEGRLRPSNKSVGDELFSSSIVA